MVAVMRQTVQNLSAPFICEVPPFKAVLVAALKKADFLFGNETEAAAFAKTEGWETTDVAAIAAKISEKMGGSEKPLTVVRLTAHVTPLACLFLCVTDRAIKQHRGSRNPRPEQSLG
jgi:sugar/nucleoside kinase (ribokinase family)